MIFYFYPTVLNYDYLGVEWIYWGFTLGSKGSIKYIEVVALHHWLPLSLLKLIFLCLHF